MKQKSEPYLNIYETYILTNPYRYLAELDKNNTKKFVCKGKGHQYEKVSNKWICQCGKEL